MPTGGCFCDAVKISYPGEIQQKALCHCRDCQKMSGSAYSVNIIVPKKGFEVIKGKPKTISKVADSNYNITSYFCGDCGTTLYRLGDWVPDSVIIKAGILDDIADLQAAKPDAEIWARSRLDWLHPVDGTVTKMTMS